MLHCAIRENGVFRGYIGFDDCKEPRMWTREQIELLTFFSEALSMFLLRQRRQEKVQRQADEMRFILDSQDAWIYVVDPETHTLLHINSRLREKHPGIRPGMTCYRALENQNVPLPECPLRMMGNKNNYSCLLRDRDSGEPILLESTRIQWDGKEAVLVSGRNLPK
jgi:putative two-component system response regulator